MKFSITDFFCELRIWSHLLKKSLIENFIFMLHTDLTASNDHKNLFHFCNKGCYYGKNLLILEKAVVFPLPSFVYLMINTPINKFHKHQVEFWEILYDLSQLLEMHTIPTLIHLFSTHPFSAHWKHLKILDFLIFSGGTEREHWEPIGWNVCNNLWII